MTVLGIDIGGSGIKGAPVDVEAGRLTAERFRLETPQPSLPEAVAETVRRVTEVFPETTGAIGVTFPAIVRDGITLSASNVDDSWIGTDARSLFTAACGRPAAVINDADAAGLAEAGTGAAAGRRGAVIVITLGTGIGSALLMDGALVPNTELGFLEMGGIAAERTASNRARVEEGLSFAEWAERLNDYFAKLDRLFSPDLLVIGGGISKQFHQFGPLLRSRAPIVPAAFRNQAGIIGAAMWADRLRN